MNPNPQDGGSYRRNADGSLTLLSPTTAERPCKCRPQSISNNDPALPASPPIEHVDEPDVIATEERTAEPGEALPPVATTTRRTKRKE
ncbi:MAG: hypothetical protein WDA70_03635 [Lysobacteraceae bacterium]